MKYDGYIWWLLCVIIRGGGVRLEEDLIIVYLMWSIKRWILIGYAECLAYIPFQLVWDQILSPTRVIVGQNIPGPVIINVRKNSILDRNFSLMKQPYVFYFEDLLYLALHNMDWIMGICRCYLLVQLHQQLIWQWCSRINFTRPLLPSVCVTVL